MIETRSRPILSLHPVCWLDDDWWLVMVANSNRVVAWSKENMKYDEAGAKTLKYVREHKNCMCGHCPNPKHNRLKETHEDIDKADL